MLVYLLVVPSINQPIKKKKNMFSQFDIQTHFQTMYSRTDNNVNYKVVKPCLSTSTMVLFVYKLRFERVHERYSHDRKIQ